ncbi:hypothetical protein C2G38_2030797 [Gigaspora rosea]|uniref:Uncharacterized protein n=1 Tax=Gigaspora rosea TaxID=44941 RepID=A0A397VT73_9GLOM|nr:hypothetical protein C2G38_2030797 [Gigaspora rosea]
MNEFVDLRFRILFAFYNSCRDCTSRCSCAPASHIRVVPNLGKCYSKTLKEKNATTLETRAAALVPKKCSTLDVIRSDNGKKMKKVHNTRSKDRETIALIQLTTTKEKEAETTPSSAIFSASTTDSTSSDWMEIMEREAETIDLQRQHKVDDNLMKNSTVFDVEGSGNLCNDRSDQSGETISPNLQIVSITRI